MILARKCVGCNTDVEVVFVKPATTELLTSLRRSVVAEYPEARQELLELHFPVEKNARWDDDEMWSPYATVAG